MAHASWNPHRKRPPCHRSSTSMSWKFLRKAFCLKWITKSFYSLSDECFPAIKPIMVFKNQEWINSPRMLNGTSPLAKDCWLKPHKYIKDQDKTFEPYYQLTCIHMRTFDQKFMRLGWQYMLINITPAFCISTPPKHHVWHSSSICSSFESTVIFCVTSSCGCFIDQIDERELQCFLRTVCIPAS